MGNKKKHHRALDRMPSEPLPRNFAAMAPTTPYGPVITQRHPPVTPAGAGLIATAIIMPVVATLWTILRIWTRKIRGVSTWFMEDILCYLAVVCRNATMLLVSQPAFADMRSCSFSSGVLELITSAVRRLEAE